MVWFFTKQKCWFEHFPVLTTYVKYEKKRKLFARMSLLDIAQEIMSLFPRIAHHVFVCIKETVNTKCFNIKLIGIRWQSNQQRNFHQLAYCIFLVNMVNLTEAGCNITRSFGTLNVSGDKLYVNECLGVRTCMLVSECSSLIQEYIFPDFSEWIIIAIYSLIFILGLIGNGLVCFVVIRITHMRTIINIFILNLALADFMVLLICLPPSLLADTTESWYLGDVMCKIVPFLQVRINNLWCKRSMLLYCYLLPQLFTVRILKYW